MRHGSCAPRPSTTATERPIAAATLRKRLPRALALAEERNRNLYHASAKETEKLTQSICDFVSLCEKKERETGEPVRIMAWY